MRTHCPSCGFAGNVPDDAVGKQATCPQCRDRFVISPPPVVETSESLRIAERPCPVCGREALQAVEGGLEQLECPQCQGSFLQAGAVLRLLKEHLRIDPRILADLETFTRADPLACPGCGQPMTLITVRDNKVDYCASCKGMWLDAGELHRLTGARFGSELQRSRVTEAGSPQHALESLLTSTPVLHIRQDSEMSASTVLLGWDHANFYDVRGPVRSLGVIRERSGDLSSALLRNYLGSHRALEAQVLDPSQSQVLLELQRPFFMFLSTMEVRSPAWNRLIGKVQRRFHLLHRAYDLLDAAGRTFAKIAGPFWRPWTFRVYDPSGQERAKITKRWGGLAKEYYTRGDEFELDLGDSAWTLEQRCVLLAAAISIDLDLFERRGAD